MEKYQKKKKKTKNVRIYKKKKTEKFSVPRYTHIVTWPSIDGFTVINSIENIRSNIRRLLDSSVLINSIASSIAKGLHHGAISKSSGDHRWWPLAGRVRRVKRKIFRSEARNEEFNKTKRKRSGKERKRRKKEREKIKNVLMIPAVVAKMVSILVIVGWLAP